MADPIYEQGPVTVPYIYTVSGTGEVIPIDAYADFDGTGAAGSYLPTLRFRSQFGHIIGQSQLSSTLAAGASASVSWFRGVKAAAAAAAASSGLPFAQMHTGGGGVTIASSALNTYVSIHDTGGVAQFETSDSSIFTNGSSTAFTGSPVFGIQINKAGTYRVINNSFVLSGGTAGRIVIAYWTASLGVGPSLFQSGRTGNVNIEAWDNQQAGQGPHLFTEEWMGLTSGQVPSVLARYGRVASGGNILMTLQMIVEQISTYVATKL